MVRALLLALLAAAAGLAAAQTEPSLVWHERNVAAQYWADGSGKASLEAARAAFEANQGRPADPNQVMPLGGGVAIWYRLQLPAVTMPARAMLTVTFPGTDSVELFRPDGAGGWRAQRAGDSLPVSQWPVPYLYPAFAFTLQPQELQSTYLRVQHTHPIRVNWVLSDAGGFNAASKAWHLALGIYVGFMLLVLMLSVVNTFSWRDPIHVYYAVHVLLVGLSILSLTGLAGEYLWPNNAWWNDKAPTAIPAASLGWAALFVRELVAERGARLVSWSLLGLAALGFVMAVGGLAIARENYFRAPSLYLVPGMLLILGVLTWYSLRRPKVGLWVLGGIAVLTVCSLWPLLRNLGLINPSFLTDYGPQIGGALEIPLVLVGLYFRGRERRDSRVRLEALSHTDPLTGLGNHRVLMARLDPSAAARPARSLAGRRGAGARGQPGRHPRGIWARSGGSRHGAVRRVRGARRDRRRHGGARAGRRPGAGAGRPGDPWAGRRSRAQHHRPRAQVLAPAAAGRDALVPGGCGVRALARCRCGGAAGPAGPRDPGDRRRSAGPQAAHPGARRAGGGVGGRRREHADGRATRVKAASTPPCA